MSKWIFGVVLFLVATVTWAQTRKSDPRLQYVGAITIYSANPKALAGWYTEKLGLDASSEYHGLYYGSFSTKSGDFNLGIHPLPAGAKVGTPNIAITFESRISSHTPPISGAEGWCRSAKRTPRMGTSSLLRISTETRSLRSEERRVGKECR